jgi:RNA polymerase sigma-70 factor (ECF subfamily)
MSRAAARVDSHGVLVPLERQDTALWNAQLIAQGEGHLLRAHQAGRIGRFQLEAAIQSAHCARKATGDTDLVALRTLYDGLMSIAPTAGASVSRAAVIGQTEGAQAGLDALDAIDQAITARFQPAWATRGHLLSRAGRKREARDAFATALSLTTDSAERAYLNARSAELG